MPKFQARLEAPSLSDTNYRHFTKGGTNYCIEISDGSCLPNCTGYAWGRWRELLGSFHKLSRNHAEKWYLNTADGYRRGNKPKLGSVICYSLGIAGNNDDGKGHVAIVEKINDDGSIVVSQSNYGGERWELKNIPADYSYPGTSLKFQGFIYLPIEFEEEEKKQEITTEEAIHKMALDVIAGKYGNGEKRKQNLYKTIQAEVNNILG